MTEYEMADLYMQFKNSAAVSFMDFVSVLFAVLVTGYLVGSKLTRPMVAIVVVLFTLFTLIILLVNFDALMNMVNIASKIQLASEQTSSDLTWMFKGTPAFLLNFTPILTGSVITIAYTAALVFFFHARHRMAFARVPQKDNHSENNLSEKYVEPLVD